MSDIVRSLKEFSLEFEQEKERFHKVGKQLIKKTLNKIFDSFPEVKSIYWHQYTPYFNDGDPCLFTIREIFASELTVDQVDNSDDGFYGGISRYNSGDHKELSAMLAIFEDCLGQIEDVVKAAFGDHALVIATRKNIEIREYEHD